MPKAIKIYQYVEVPDSAEPSKTVKRAKVVKEGRGVQTGHLKPPFYARPSVDGRQYPYQRLNAQTFTEAKIEAAKLPEKLRAERAGLSQAEAKAGMVTIKSAVETYLALKAKKAKKTVMAYRNILNQFVELAGVRFLSGITVDVLRKYKNALEAEPYIT